MQNFGSALMHMTTLGVEKSLISKTKILVDRKKGLADRKLWEDLTNSMNDTLKAVDQTSLDWCMTMSFSGKDPQALGTSNWQSDHYLAYTRLSLFHFGRLDGEISIPEGKKALFAAFKRVRLVWFCLMSSILADNCADSSRVDDLVKLFLQSCREMWKLSMVKLTGDEFEEDEATDSKDNEETSEATKARGKRKKSARNATGENPPKRTEGAGNAKAKAGQKRKKSACNATDENPPQEDEEGG